MRRTAQCVGLVCVVALICARSLSAGVGGGSLIRTHVIGGNAVEAITAADMLPNGDVVVCGYTNSPQVITVPGLIQDAPGGYDAFVAVLSADLLTLKYWTFYGGTRDDKATALGVMPNGTIIVTGETASPNLTMSIGAFAQLHGGEVDGFVIKLSADLDSLFFSTYIPGNKDERPTALLVDPAGSVYICGTTSSPYGFLTNNGYDRSFNGGVDAFVLKMSPNGGSLAFSTYFGGDGNDAFLAMTLTGDGGLALTGYTTSSTFECFPVPKQWNWPPVVPPYDNSYNGGATDAVLTIMSQDGARLITSGFYGGSGADYGNVIHADLRGDVFVAGTTWSPNLPIVLGSQASLNGGSDGFLAVFDPTGVALKSSTFLGGSGNDEILDAVSSGNNMWTLLGNTSSRDFSGEGSGTTGDVYGPSDLFIARAAISGVSYFTTLGWGGAESGAELFVDKRGDAYVAGATDARSITSNGITTQNLGPVGTTEGFVLKWAYGTLDLTAPRGGERVCAGQNLNVTWSTLDLGMTEEFELEYSSDGVTWTSAGSKIKNRSLSWLVPTSLVVDQPYYLRITSSHGHVSQSSGTFFLREPASIVRSPLAQHVCKGEDVVLSVVASGEDISYQWKRNGVLLPNERTPQLSLTNIPTSSAGNYEAVVTNACGSVTSAAATVIVDADVTIIDQPTDKVVMVGQTLTLMVRAQGLDITYTWTRNGQTIPNAGSAELRIPNVALSDAGLYEVVLVGRCGSDTSRVATVEVSTDPVSVFETKSPAFTLAPNPASDVADITVTHPANITITDIRGQIVHVSNATFEAAYPAKIRLNLEPLAVGAYIVTDGVSVRLLQIVR